MFLDEKYHEKVNRSTFYKKVLHEYIMDCSKILFADESVGFSKEGEENNSSKARESGSYCSNLDVLSNLKKWIMTKYNPNGKNEFMQWKNLDLYLKGFNIGDIKKHMMGDKANKVLDMYGDGEREKWVESKGLNVNSIVGYETCEIGYVEDYEEDKGKDGNGNEDGDEDSICSIVFYVDEGIKDLEWFAKKFWKMFDGHLYGDYVERIKKGNECEKCDCEGCNKVNWCGYSYSMKHMGVIKNVMKRVLGKWRLGFIKEDKDEVEDDIGKVERFFGLELEWYKVIRIKKAIKDRLKEDWDCSLRMLDEDSCYEFKYWDAMKLFGGCASVYLECERNRMWVDGMSGVKKIVGCGNSGLGFCMGCMGKCCDEIEDDGNWDWSEINGVGKNECQKCRRWIEGEGKGGYRGCEMHESFVGISMKDWLFVDDGDWKNKGTYVPCVRCDGDDDVYEARERFYDRMFVICNGNYDYDVNGEICEWNDVVVDFDTVRWV